MLTRFSKSRAGSEPECKSCGSTTVIDLGPLPELVPTFGGQMCSVQHEPGRLWRCRHCDLYFRFPYLTQVELTALYQDLPDSVWSTAGENNYAWKRIGRLCERFAANKKILDIGCFAGDFL